MKDLDVKKLKIIAGIIIVLIVAIFIGLIATSKAPEEEVEAIVSEAYNNNEKVVHYSGDIYCYSKVLLDGKWTNALVKLPIEYDDATTRMIVQEFSAIIEDVTLFFDNNRIFYIMGGNTYMYDIVKNKVDKFCDGELQFFCDKNSFVTFYGSNFYKGEYYPATFFAKSYTQITDGLFKVFDEDNENIYCTSPAGSNTLVVAFNKENLNIVVLDNFVTKNQIVEDVLATDDFIYELINLDGAYSVRIVTKDEKIGGKSIAYKTVAIEAGKHAEFIDSMYTKPTSSTANIKRNDLYLNIGDMVLDPNSHMTDYNIVNEQIYKYDQSNDKLELYNGVFNELWLDNYELTYSAPRVDLYYRNKYITSIETDFTGNVTLEMVSVNIIEDYLYYEFLISDGNRTENILARTLKNGGHSQRINTRR